LDKKELVKKNIKDYESFINSLDKMPELVPNKELCDIAKEELKKLSEDENYNKYQIGEEFKSKLSDKFSQKDTSLIANEDLKKIDEIIPKIIINEGDSDKKGRNILIN
jgi:Fe-S oxidoreductase